MINSNIDCHNLYLKKVNKFWKRILSSKDPTSSKRLITIILSGVFIVAQVAIIFIAFYVIFYTTKGKVDKDLLQMLSTVLEYDFYIILSGLSFVTADNIAQVVLEKAKLKLGVNNSVPTEDQAQDI